MSAEVHARAAIAREGNDATRLEANVPSARRSALQIARLRSRTRLQRATPASSVAQVMTARFASIVAHRPITEGAINTGRFIALGLPDTRAP